MNEPPVNAPAKKAVHRWGIRLMVPLLAAAIVLCIVAAKWQKEQKLLRVVVEGTSVMTVQQITAAASLPAKAQMEGLDLYESRRHVAALPYVADVGYFRSFPGTLCIRVSERKPIAGLNDGQMRYVDAEGYLLPSYASGSKPDVPIISGVDPVTKTQPGEPVGPGEVAEAIGVLRTAQEVDTAMYHFISEVNMNRGKDIILYSTDLAVPIYLGRDDVGKKLVTLQAWWNGVAKGADPSKLQYVDLRFDDQVVVKWQGDAKPKQAL